MENDFSFGLYLFRKMGINFLMGLNKMLFNINKHNMFVYIKYNKTEYSAHKVYVSVEESGFWPKSYV